ncbi:response regulator [Chryseobacterium sp. RR2-3-20]|uniref:response regulator n=1 Tax=Chryseobacterium sp. RR2-3-20 TaxID=2787626 RepID=UPI001ADF2569|nr:response regulator [Chryseobacterium sp. RR2-3-20]
MQIINFFSESTGNALNIDYVQIPNDLDRLSDFEISEPEEDKVYLIEVSPNKPNNLKYHGVEIFLKSYFKSLTSGVEKVRFILCGFEDELSFFKYCELSQVLKLPNVSYLQINASFNENLLKIESDAIQKIAKSLALQGIRNINIRRPLSYKTNHSIINEWSIFRWSQILCIEQNLPEYIKHEIKNSLFFRYLMTINEIKETDIISNSNLSSGISSSVLLIDDEEEKGWQSFFKTLLGNNVKFDSIGKDFKSESIQEGVIEEAKRKILQSHPFPDIVILDLRLHDHDYTNGIKPSDLTGIKILQEIKNINKGIQVIVFSATNKATNLQYALDVGADGFIMKESPENSKDSNYSKESVNQIISILKTSSKRSFLKDIWEKISTLNDVIDNSAIPFINSFYQKAKIELEKAFAIINLADPNSSSDKSLSFGFLQLFQIIEDFASEIIDSDDQQGYYYVNDIIVRKMVSRDSKKVYKFEEPIKYDHSLRCHKLADNHQITESRTTKMDLNYKIGSIMIFMFGFSNSNVKNWPEINIIRHKFVHDGIRVRHEEVCKILDFITFLIDDKNVNYDINRFNGIEY